jgi:hypothetical protein
MKYRFQSFWVFFLRNIKIAFFVILTIYLSTLKSFSQTTEVYAGHKRLGVDIMWFKYFQNKEQQNSPFLFFSRNRASTDYDNKSGAFGSVNAVSYNFKNGLGIVTVGSLLNSGFTGKLGVQYFKQKGGFMFFGWAVADLKKKGNLDVFGMFRYQAALSESWKLFTQVELFTVYNPSNNYWFLTQRVRIGPKFKKSSFGLMADFSQFGKNNFQTANNFGAFLRHDF